MNISLPKGLQGYVENLVENGEYSGASDVVQEALRLHKASRLDFEVVMSPQLKELLTESLNDPRPDIPLARIKARK